MNLLIIFFCLCVTAFSSCKCDNAKCNCDSGNLCRTNLPEPKETSCGLISRTNVRNLIKSFEDFAKNVSQLRENYDKSSFFVLTGLDSFYDYHPEESSDNCWIFIPLSTRIYLDFLTLKNFSQPLNQVLHYEKGNEDTSKDADTSLLVSSFKRNVDALDCVMQYAGITSEAWRNLPQIETKIPTLAPTFKTEKDNFRVLRDLNKVIVQVLEDLITMSECRPPNLHLPQQCPLIM